MRAGGLLLPLLLLAGPSRAEDFVRAQGPLDDAAFYRLITCGGPPGGACRIPPKRWPPELVRDLTVSLLPDVDPVRPARRAQVDAALDAAIAQLNATGAALTLRRVADNSPARIRLSIRSPATLALIAKGHGAEETPGGMVLFLPPAEAQITGATILISAAIGLTETNSIVLEELTQSLGLVYDIDNPAYDRRSIFSQEGNGVTVIAGQDAIALRMHYPPQP